MPKSSCLKWTYGHPGIDYRVASLIPRYLTAIGIIPENLNSIGQLFYNMPKITKRHNCLIWTGGLTFIYFVAWPID